MRGESALEWEFINIFPSLMTFIKKYSEERILDRNQI
jgi:hypothetical protein